MMCQEHPVWCTPKGTAGEDTWAHGGCTGCRQFEQKSNFSFLSFNEPNAVSTPVSRPVLDQTSKNRITELEDELQKLREQVARLVMIQETSNTMSSMNGRFNTHIFLFYESCPKLVKSCCDSYIKVLVTLQLKLELHQKFFL